MPDVRLVNLVQHQVGQRNRVDQILFLAPVKGGVFERFDLIGCGFFTQCGVHVFIRLSKKSACATTRIIDGLTKFRVDRLDHHTNHLTRREELTTVVALLAHFEEQAFVDL